MDPLREAVARAYDEAAFVDLMDVVVSASMDHSIKQRAIAQLLMALQAVQGRCCSI